MDGWALAVDIGETSVAAAVSEQGRTAVVAFPDGPTMSPAVFCPPGQAPIAGPLAAPQLAAAPQRAVLAPKRALAQGDTVTVAGEAVALAEIYAALLSAVTAQAARDRVPAVPPRLVLTFPAAPRSRELDVLLAAARSAGLPAPDLVPELVAAAWCLAADSAPGQLVAVLDTGGSRIDTAVLRRTADGFKFAGQPGTLARPADDPEEIVRRGADELLATTARAGLAPDQLAAVCVTGQASRIANAAVLITQTLGIFPRLAPDPRTAVALGALTGVLGPAARARGA
jgi:molecular chaperone DnaK (HSP70)